MTEYQERRLCAFMISCAAVVIIVLSSWKSGWIMLVLGAVQYALAAWGDPANRRKTDRKVEK